MAQALQFTPEQLAKQLDLSETVVHRLSMVFQIPRRYYQPAAGEARILLYTAFEMDILRQIQQMLIAGRSLTEIKREMEPVIASQETMPVSASVHYDEPSWDGDEEEVDEDTDLDWDTDVDESDLEEDDGEDEDLQGYERHEHLKEQLAEVTFKQYRHQTRTAGAPFENLVQRLHAQPERPAATLQEEDAAVGMTRPVTRSASVAQMVSAVQELTPPPTMTISYGYSWMSADLRQRALEIQRELLLKSH